MEVTGWLHALDAVFSLCEPVHDCSRVSLSAAASWYGYIWTQRCAMKVTKTLLPHYNPPAAQEMDVQPLEHLQDGVREVCESLL
jgi:hypothetical protein